MFSRVLIRKRNAVKWKQNYRISIKKKKQTITSWLNISMKFFFKSPFIPLWRRNVLKKYALLNSKLDRLSSFKHVFLFLGKHKKKAK